MSSRELAALALERGWVSSAASDPVFSIASTIEKNIRVGTYNRPQLVFVKTPTGRRIGLPNWKPEDLHFEPTRRTVAVQIPEELADKLRLATQARIAPSFDATLALILRKGLAAAAPNIKAAMMRQLESLEQVGGRRYPGETIHYSRRDDQ